MGSKQSAPIIIRDQPSLACDMRNSSFKWSEQGIPILSLLGINVLILSVCIVSFYCYKRYHHRKLGQYTRRVPVTEEQPLTRVEVQYPAPRPDPAVTRSDQAKSESSYVSRSSHK